MYTRAWCLLEVFYSTRNNIPFEVFLTEDQLKNYREMNSSQTLMIFSSISTRNSTCWNLNDKLRIHELIENAVGFEEMDVVVRKAIANALHPVEDSTGMLLASDGGDSRSPGQGSMMVGSKV